jgi:hypothetical protein
MNQKRIGQILDENMERNGKQIFDKYVLVNTTQILLSSHFDIILTALICYLSLTGTGN